MKIAVGAVFEVRLATPQVVRRPVDRQQQGDDPAIGLALGDGRPSCAFRVREKLVGCVEVSPEPGPQPIPNAGDLTVAADRGQWHGVDEVANDAFARLNCFDAILIRPQGRREHLPQLLGDRGGTPPRRMANLLKLCRQGAATADRMLRIHGVDAEVKDGIG